MRRFLVSAFAAAAIALVLTPPAGAQLKLPRPSPGASVTQTIGLTDLTVAYSRPGVKGRTIWGDLVPMDKPWRTGANEATTLTTTDEITFGGQKLAAGTYALATIPGKDEWIVAVNRDKDMWGTAYDEKKDVMRVKVKATPAAEPTEWMQFTFENLTPNSGELVLRWEKLRVAIPITVDANGKAMANARAAVDTASAGNWRTPYQAASFTFNNDHGMNEGEKWLQKSLAVQENYYNLNLLARWQAKTGKKTEAVATAKKALEAAKKSTDTIDTVPTEKLIAEWTK
jgi:hypothetical protein